MVRKRDKIETALQESYQNSLSCYDVQFMSEYGNFCLQKTEKFKWVTSIKIEIISIIYMKVM